MGHHYRERHTNGDHDAPKDEQANTTLSLDGREVAKTIERSRKRKSAAKKTATK